MKKLRRTYPIWISAILTAVFPIAALIGALPLLLFSDLWNQSMYLTQLLGEIPVLLTGVLLALLLRMGYIFQPGYKGLRACILPMLPIIGFYTAALWSTLAVEGFLRPVAPLTDVAVFTLCMLAIGITEELFFRGLMTRMIFEKYGRNSLGVWLSVLASSLLFGLVHLMNAVGSTEILSSVLVQAVAAAMLGMCLSAIYLRTNSLWAVALLHGYMDFCALASSGLFGGTILEDIGGYSVYQLVGALVYALLALFLLRPSQMKKILETRRQREPQTSEIVKLMIAVMLLSGLFAAVLVLSV